MKVHYGNSATGREKDYDYNAHKKHSLMKWTVFWKN